MCRRRITELNSCAVSSISQAEQISLKLLFQWRCGSQSLSSTGSLFQACSASLVDTSTCPWHVEVASMFLLGNFWVCSNIFGFVLFFLCTIWRCFCKCWSAISTIECERHLYFRTTNVFSALEVCYENALYKFAFDIDIEYMLLIINYYY